MKRSEIVNSAAAWTSERIYLEQSWRLIPPCYDKTGLRDQSYTSGLGLGLNILVLLPTLECPLQRKEADELSKLH